MRIGNKDFDVKNKTYIMGILNVTPDSFSDGGKWKDQDAALRHAEEMIADGAAVISEGNPHGRGTGRFQMKKRLIGWRR